MIPLRVTIIIFATFLISLIAFTSVYVVHIFTKDLGGIYASITPLIAWILIFAAGSFLLWRLALTLTYRKK